MSGRDRDCLVKQLTIYVEYVCTIGRQVIQIKQICYVKQGTWGKRGWDRLSGSWGKRMATDDPELDEFWDGVDKRPEWGKLKGT